MQLVINIDDKLYNRIKYLEPRAGSMLDELMRSVQNGTPFPKGATNGDMIKAITGEDFSRGASIYNHDLMICEGEYYLAFDINWWNAPYKAEVEE